MENGSDSVVLEVIAWYLKNTAFDSSATTRDKELCHVWQWIPSPARVTSCLFEA
jgi:hypothetical protein